MDPRDPTRGESEPGRCWTLTNVSEATPDVLSPLCWSFWVPNCELGARAAWCDFGVLPRSEVRLPRDPNHFVSATFFGRQALNVDLTRSLLGTLPGTSGDIVEQEICGTVRPGLPPVSTAWSRVPVMAGKAPRLAAIQTARVRRLHTEELARWQTAVLGEADSRDPQARLSDATEHFRRSMHTHVRTRFLLQPLQSVITALAGRAGRSDLAGRLFAGFGQVAETQIADDVWELSRDRLSEREFIARHGFHGPNEGNLTGTSWRQDQQPIKALAEAMARRPDEDRPRVREQAAGADHRRAVGELLAALGRAQRPGARLVLRMAATHARNLELGKAAFLMAIDSARATAWDLGDQLVAQRRLDRPDDVFFFTTGELAGSLSADARELCAFRRDRREEYRGLEIPSVFVGMPEPRPRPAFVGGNGVISGQAGSAGVAEGRARVILEPDDDILEPGEILVCRFTDPSWVIQMALAEGLVIDIGGPASHGAIVARELGVPCVIGTGNGTARIRTGDRLRVDGNTGEVRVLDDLAG